MPSLSIDRCPHGTYAIAVNDDIGGTRLTTGKCCGRWDVVKNYDMTPKKLREVAATLINYAESAESREG